MDWVRSLGVTTIHTGHGPGALISGQTMILKASSLNISDGMLVPFAMQSGFGSYVPKTRVVLFEAAMAATYGLPFESDSLWEVEPGIGLVLPLAKVPRTGSGDRPILLVTFVPRCVEPRFKSFMRVLRGLVGQGLMFASFP